MSASGTTNERYSVATERFKLFFTTDFYPAETTWRLVDEDLNIIAADGPYQAGTEDQWGGGGPDAAKTFEYDIETSVDVSCLSMQIFDSAQDGLSAITFDHVNNNEPPGVEIVDNKGNVIKSNEIMLDATQSFLEVLTGEGTNWGSATTVNVNTEMTSSINDLSGDESIEVYPNPVNDLLSVDFNISTKSDVSVSITNALGQQVLFQTIGQNSGRFTEKLDVTNLENGIYNMYIQLDDREVVKRFRKQ